MSQLVNPHGSKELKPLLLEGASVAPLIIEMVEKAASIGVVDGPTLLLDACLKVMACHGAIRAHQSLTAQHLEALLKQLAACHSFALQLRLCVVGGLVFVESVTATVYEHPVATTLYANISLLWAEKQVGRGTFRCIELTCYEYAYFNTSKWIIQLA